MPVPASRVAHSAEEAAAAAEELGFPVVVKALGVAHKSDVGGVRLDLRSADEVAAALDLMAGLSESYLVERMVEGAVTELIVGVARDPQFGPYLVVGGGGILVELMKDSASLLLPVTREHVLEALGALQCAPLLELLQGLPAGRPERGRRRRHGRRGHGGEGPRRRSPSWTSTRSSCSSEGKGAVAADALVRLNA